MSALTCGSNVAEGFERGGAQHTLCVCVCILAGLSEPLRVQAGPSLESSDPVQHFMGLRLRAVSYKVLQEDERPHLHSTLIVPRVRACKGGVGPAPKHTICISSC